MTILIFRKEKKPCGFGPSPFQLNRAQVSGVASGMLWKLRRES